jgi:hypothetical protein
MKNSLLILALGCAYLATAQTEIEKVTQNITKSEIEGHIYFLADDVLKGRATGSPELKIAASYLANTFRGYGVQPNPKTGTYYQEVKLKSVSPPKEASIKLNNQTITDFAFLNAAALTSNQDAVFLNYGLADDYKGKNISGKVIIVKAGTSESNDVRTAYGLNETKKQLAIDNGATGVIELIVAEDAMWGNIKHSFNETRMTVDLSDDTKSDAIGIPYIWVLDNDSKMADQLSAMKIISSKIAISEKEENAVISQNLIGVVEGTDPILKNEYIIYSAHYDHVGIGEPDETGDTIYNGARDNAVGTTTVLSMAKNLAKYPTKRSALFILFTGEEKGLLGSSYYVENPVLPLNQMVFCFNSDNAGYNDTSLISIIGLTRTSAEENIFNAAKIFGLKAIEDPAAEQGLFDRSDNVNFAKKGIPAPTFSLGFTSFDEDVTKYYHRPGDEAQTLDYDYLLKFFQAYVLAGRYIANDPKTPIWNTGDKYDEASKELYRVNTTKN